MSLISRLPSSRAAAKVPKLLGAVSKARGVSLGIAGAQFGYFLILVIYLS